MSKKVQVIFYMKNGQNIDLPNCNEEAVRDIRYHLEKYLRGASESVWFKVGAGGPHETIIPWASVDHVDIRRPS